jgi:hypothetical protein
MQGLTAADTRHVKVEQHDVAMRDVVSTDAHRMRRNDHLVALARQPRLDSIENDLTVVDD